MPASLFRWPARESHSNSGSAAPQHRPRPSADMLDGEPKSRRCRYGATHTGTGPVGQHHMGDLVPNRHIPIPSAPASRVPPGFTMSLRLRRFPGDHSRGSKGTQTLPPLTSESSWRCRLFENCCTLGITGSILHQSNKIFTRTRVSRSPAPIRAQRRPNSRNARLAFPWSEIRGVPKCTHGIRTDSRADPALSESRTAFAPYAQPAAVFCWGSRGPRRTEGDSAN